LLLSASYNPYSFPPIRFIIFLLLEEYKAGNMNDKVQVISRRSHVPEERGGTPAEKIPPVYAFRAVKVHGNQGFFRMVVRQVDKVILFPLKWGSKCGKMDKKEMPDAEAIQPLRPAFFNAILK
jgi:hypothetical protein